MPGAGDIKAGAAFVELYADSSGVVKGLDDAKAKIEQWRVATQAANKATLKTASATEEALKSMKALGKVAAVARIATEGMEIAAALLEGDFNRAADAFKRIPIIGPGGTAGFRLGYAGASAFLGPGAVSGDTGNYVDELRAAATALAEIEKMQAAASRDEKFIKLAGITKELALSEEKRLAALQKIDDLLEKGGGKNFAAALEARAAVNAKAAAEQSAAIALDLVRQDKIFTEREKEQAEKDRKIAEAKNAASAAAADEARERQNANEIRSLEADRDISLHVQEALAAMSGAAIIGQGNRGVTATSAAAVQSLQTTPALNKMVQNLDDIKRTNQLIADNAARFN